MAEPSGGAAQGDAPRSAHAMLLEFAMAAKRADGLRGQEAIITEELDGIIHEIAHSGVANGYPWDALRWLLVRKLERVLIDFKQDRDDLPLREGETFEVAAVEPLMRSLLEPRREGAPWTLQRLCELLSEPRRIYTSTRKYVYALQRAVLVTSTEEALVWRLLLMPVGL